MLKTQSKLYQMKISSMKTRSPVNKGFRTILVRLRPVHPNLLSLIEERCPLKCLLKDLVKLIKKVLTIMNCTSSNSVIQEAL